MFHPARKVRDVYWKIYNSLYIGSQVTLIGIVRFLCYWHWPGVLWIDALNWPLVAAKLSVFTSRFYQKGNAARSERKLFLQKSKISYYCYRKSEQDNNDTQKI